MEPAGAGYVWSAARLWRYPVKSMLGEEVDSADVVWSGFYGNRCYALVDAESSRLVSAKNPAKWGRMFECTSRLLGRYESAEDRESNPAVRIALPGGREFDIKEGDYGGSEEALSTFLGRKVGFVASSPRPREVVMEQYHPMIEEDDERGLTTEFARSKDAQAGTFTDSAAVHIVTTSTLRTLKGLLPGGNFDPLRFRPNILVDTGDAEGIVERTWVGKEIAVGEAKLRVFAECGRCVMTTLPQGEIRPDTRILSTVIRHNRGKTGVLASVVAGGRVRTGDSVKVLPSR